MKSKKITLTLSLFFGSAGTDRFYLGQNTAGWLTLFIFWVLLPGVDYCIIQFNVVPNWQPFLLARFALPIMYHLVTTGRYLVMSDEKFKSQDHSKGKTFLLTIVSILSSAVLIVSANKMLDTAQVIDITKADAQAVLSAETMSGEFRKDESAYRKQYDNKVLQIEGVITETGNDFEQGAYFALKGLNNDPFGIKCFFVQANLHDTELVKMGDTIVIKGVCNGNKLENCKLISVNGKTIPLTNN